jgi:hypothetical protein
MCLGHLHVAMFRLWGAVPVCVHLTYRAKLGIAVRLRRNSLC